MDSDKITIQYFMNNLESVNTDSRYWYPGDYKYKISGYYNSIASGLTQKVELLSIPLAFYN